jgi:hypothetical protein
MIKYKNLGRNSGVTAYETAENSIKVLFNDGALYLYNNVRPGKASVEKMKLLAQRGQGLNSLISREIKKNYYDKIS